MKSKLLEATTPQELEIVLGIFLNHDNFYSTTEPPKTLHHVQDYITQVIEQNKFDPRQGQQKITYYLLIIYS